MTNARGEPVVSTQRLLTKALYLQVRDEFAQRIATGQWKPGFAIPSESDLARDLTVSSGTVRKALELLEADKLVTRRQGRGTFVNDPAPDELACRFIRLRSADGQSVSGEVTSQAISEGVADERECTRLQLRTGDRVYRIRRVRARRGCGFMVADVVLPATLYPRLAGEANIPTQVGALAPWNGLLLGPAEERVTICVPSKEVTCLLGVTSGTPVLLLDCVLTLLGTHRPAAWRIGYVHLPDGYYFAELN